MSNGTVSIRSAGIYAAPMTTLRLLATAVSLAIFVPFSLVLAQEKERSVTVGPDETVRIWFGANYGRRCATAGAPIFSLISKAFFCEVGTELGGYTLLTGQ